MTSLKMEYDEKTGRFVEPEGILEEVLKNMKSDIDVTPDGEVITEYDKQKTFVLTRSTARRKLNNEPPWLSSCCYEPGKEGTCDTCETRALVCTSCEANNCCHGEIFGRFESTTVYQCSGCGELYEDQDEAMSCCNYLEGDDGYKCLGCDSLHMYDYEALECCAR